MRRPSGPGGDWPADWPFAAVSDVLRSVAGMLGERPATEETLGEPSLGLRVDVIDAEAELIIRADLPGVRKQELEVTATDADLTISGELKRDEEFAEEAYHRAERRVGRFSRTVALPAAIKPDQVTARLADGVLEVRAPKAEAPGPVGRSIEVE